MHRIVQASRIHKRKLIIIGAVLLGILLLVQLFYPGDRLPLNARIDGLNVSAWKKQDAAWQLDKQAASQRIDIRLGTSKETYEAVEPGDIGLAIKNKSRVEKADYPWWARLVPTSVFWYGFGMDDGQPEYRSDEAAARAFLNSTLGNSCDIPPKNASLMYEEGKLRVIPAKEGGACKEDEAIAALRSVRPVAGKRSSVDIPVDIKAPAVNDEAAQALASSLIERTAEGLTLSVAGKEQTVAQDDVLSWLTFAAKGSKLTYTIDAERANIYFAKEVTPKVAKPAVITRITTRDYTVVSQTPGATGQTLALPATLANVTGVLSGTQAIAKVALVDVPPRIVYSRSYTSTSTGISAMVMHYSQDNKGTFGVAFQELGGRGLSASYNATQQFTTASTYKLFVAYGTLRKVDAGKWKWDDADISGGRNLSVCFDDMIVKSDNACAEALLKELGYSQLTKDINALGLNNSGFTQGDTPRTTASDMAMFLTKLQDGSLPIKPDSRSRLLDAMKRNVYRQGVPAGASGQTANKVGFLWGLLHDAAIVYSPKGTYVLVILTDGSTWGNIAELTRKIEALR